MTPFTMFEELLAEVRSLGVDIVEESNKLLKRLVTEGIDIQSEDDFIRTATGIFHVLPDGRIVKVILHITQKSIYTAQEPTEEDYHRFHLFNCQTLQMMESIGRGDRYRMASRADGRFNYKLLRHNRVVREFRGEEGARLRFCRNCKTIYEGRFNRSGRRPFDLEQFISTNEHFGGIAGVKSFDFDDIPNTYAADWALIAARLKEARSYQCEICRIDLSAPHLRKFLHAHHVDGQPRNNVLTNIRILCIEDHAKQPLHSHVQNSPAYQEFLRTPEYRNARFGTH